MSNLKAKIRSAPHRGLTYVNIKSRVSVLVRIDRDKPPYILCPECSAQMRGRGAIRRAAIAPRLDLVERYDSSLDGVLDQIRVGAQLKFAHEVGTMRFGGAWTYSQPMSNLVISVPLGH